MLTIRAMTHNDIALGMRLKQQAGWNQVEADWRRFLAMPPGGFVGLWNGEPAGTAVGLLMGRVGWVAMVLVDREFRGRGIGTQLTQHAVEQCQAAGASTVRLDATALGRPIYEKLGFVGEYELTRWQGVAPAASARPEVRPPTDGEFAAAVRLDRHVTATDRSQLLAQLRTQQPEALRVYSAETSIGGYLTYREGSTAVQIGPSVALSDDAGLALLDAASATLTGQTVYLDAPVDNVAASDWAEQQGFSAQRKFLRMRLGDEVPDVVERIWASSGPELG